MRREASKKVVCAILLTWCAGGCKSAAAPAPEPRVEAPAPQPAQAPKEEAAPPPVAEAAPEGEAGVVVEEVAFTSRGVRLEGQITRPRGAAPSAGLPGVLILHDHGPMDREGTVHGSLGVALPVALPVYASLARALARRGIVVMSYDKRTCVEHAGPRCAYPAPHGQVDGLAEALEEDAIQALRTLKAHPQTSEEEVWIFGHGHGADLALLSARGSRAAGVVMFAANTRPLDERIAREMQRSLALSKRRRLDEGDTAMGDLLEMQIEALERNLERQRAAFARIRSGEAGQAEDALGMRAEIWRGFIAQHERAMSALSQRRARACALYGSLDLGVHPDEVEAMRRALGNSRVTMNDGVTHNMVEIEQGSAEFSDRVAQQVATCLSAP